MHVISRYDGLRKGAKWTPPSLAGLVMLFIGHPAPASPDDCWAIFNQSRWQGLQRWRKSLRFLAPQKSTAVEDGRRAHPAATPAFGDGAVFKEMYAGRVDLGHRRVETSLDTARRSAYATLG
jgi:hypothetical protein